MLGLKPPRSEARHTVSGIHRPLIIMVLNHPGNNLSGVAEQFVLNFGQMVHNNMLV